MHPLLIILPAAALVIGPRLWVAHVLTRYNRADGDFPETAGELARRLLDRHGLQAVVVEHTELGDHYDPQARAVRINRDKFDRRTLTAVTTAAHEVAHALQHDSGYAPFVWRTRLARLAQVTGEVGFAVLVAVPVSALLSRRPVPPTLVGSAALAMLGTGMAAQLAALPTELDASFVRALPMLRQDCIREDQVADARKILFACSLTYVASSLVAVLHIWPWLGRAGALQSAGRVLSVAGAATAVAGGGGAQAPQQRRAPDGRPRGRRGPPGIAETLLRQVGKPLIRTWLRFSRDL